MTKLRVFAAVLASLLCAVLLSVPAAAQEQYRVLYHEPLEFDIGPVFAASTEDDAGVVETRTLTFTAFGRDFEVDLTANNRLTARLPQKLRDQVRSRYGIWKGNVLGAPGSWARLTQQGERLSGFIYDGAGEVFVVDSAGAVAASLEVPEAAGAEQMVVFRLSDTETLGEQTCAVDGFAAAPSTAAKSYANLVAHLQGVTAEAVGASQEVLVRAVADVEFRSQSNNPQGAMLALLNVADGIFSEQVGVQISVDQVQVLPNFAGLTATDAQQLLEQFSDFVSSDNPGLSHLFTGKNLTSVFEQDGVIIISPATLGIAFIGGLCNRRFGTGVSEALNSSLAALTVAHELGHNFGAPHDNQEGSICASTPGGFLMNPSSEDVSDEFSQCSLDQIARVVSRAACLADLEPEPEPEPDPDPEPEPDPEPPAPDDPVTLFNDNFRGDTEGWEFFDGAFRGASNPEYSAGSRENDSLIVRLGGVDAEDVFNMSGGWQREFFLGKEARLTLTARVGLVQSANYESDEVSELLIRVDDRQRTIFRVSGNGNGGNDRVRGLRTVQIDFGVFPPGHHVVVVGGFNNKKTFTDETTVIQLDTAVLVSE